MKGLVKYNFGPANMEIREMPIPEIGPGQVRVEINTAGICGTDVHIYKDEYPYQPPVIMGHEFSGIVDQVSETKKINLGDKVTGIPTTIVCGTCRYCLLGQLSLCNKRQSIGSGIHGVFTKYVVLPEWAVRQIPNNINLREAALSEPLCCCVKAVAIRTSISSGDIVVVTGPGPIGLLTTQIAKSEGAYVILTGISADKKRLELGSIWADEVVNSDEVDILEPVKDRTNGYGVDWVYECSGSPVATTLSINLVKKQGTIMQIGLHGNSFDFDFLEAELKEITIKTSFAGSLDAWDRTMILLDQGKIDLAPLVSDVFTLTEWEKAFEKIFKKEGIKIMLEPN